MPKATIPPRRELPPHLARAIAAHIGPVPRYAPGERAPGLCPFGPRYRAGGSMHAAREQAARLRRTMPRT